jgi:hypothetical protein
VSYVPNYAMYPSAPDGWHDEPFEYVYTFQFDFGAPISVAAQANLLNQPLQLDPDGDFYMRGMAAMIDQAPAGKGRIDFNMRMRDAFGRQLDSAFIPMAAYATPAFAAGPFTGLAGGVSSATPIPATPWYPELYCPKSGVMFADFQSQVLIGKSAQFYSFHLYFKGVKRFKNEACAPQ